ncbi:hypothetical protein ACIBK8_32855 [Streptomyces sp. NPDC050161]|uniref:hypothetical protein n=1 Tax=Streptomyces sp. NPDC050161 TaxID=3365604 RepID=UPI003791967D
MTTTDPHDAATALGSLRPVRARITGPGSGNLELVQRLTRQELEDANSPAVPRPREPNAKVDTRTAPEYDPPGTDTQHAVLQAELPATSVR